LRSRVCCMSGILHHHPFLRVLWFGHISSRSLSRVIIPFRVILVFAMFVCISQTVRSDGEGCDTAWVVLHVEIEESWSAARSIQYAMRSADVSVKHTNGTIFHRVLALVGTLGDLELRLYDGAQLTQLLEVDHFSSMFFREDSSKPLAACASCGWQRLRFLTSAHAVPPQQPMLVQVYRPAEALEKWSTQRSVAVDALQFLVVLTTSVSGSMERRGTASPGPSNTGWLEHRHCCVVMDVFGNCNNDPSALATTDMQKCASMKDVNGRQSVAKTFVHSRQSCHCHSTCSHTDVKTTAQDKVFLFVGDAG